MSGTPLPGVDAPLLTRLRAAGAKIAWRPAPGSSGARIAHLHDEEARIEERTGAHGRETVVDSGPVGALLLILESDRNGDVPRIDAREATETPDFPGGALIARWGAPAGERGTVPFSDVVALARYALA